ncbi:hypothetical protein LTR17_018455 [Elasticomyces elasticus]|nr:hypothetical protein LTR17_018455 [Elasticomyces elasticus]
MPPKGRPAASDNTSEDDFEDTAPASKRARMRHVRVAEHDLNSLLALPHAELAAYALSQQQKALQHPAESRHEEGSSVDGSLADSEDARLSWTEKDITNCVDDTRSNCKKQLKNLLIWQPRCMVGKTSWNLTVVVPHTDVFYQLLGFEKPAKPWKANTIPFCEFEQIFGRFSVPVTRANNSFLEEARKTQHYKLHFTGKEVKIDWNENKKSFKLSGTYGVRDEWAYGKP